MRVLRRDRPGGLIREYAQVAWGDIVSAPTDYCPSIPLAGGGKPSLGQGRLAALRRQTA